VALGVAGRGVFSVCEQERVTRVRAAGFNRTGLPDEALDELLRRAGRQRADVTTYAIAETPAPDGDAVVRLDHHYVHAASAFLPSSFTAATILVCDHGAPHISVWDGSEQTITPVDRPWTGIGFAELYSRCAEILRFGSVGREQRMEALARLEPGHRDARAERLFSLAGDRLELAAGWEPALASWVAATSMPERATIAGAVEARIGDLLIEFLAGLRQARPESSALCVGGSLFFNSHFNTRVRVESGFAQVFVPINPGNAGLATGAAMLAGGFPRQPLSPFLGPHYAPDEIKATLDNCKLTYHWASERETIDAAVKALSKGRLVGWFDGPMEWGARALGARSILANPLAPFALDNLNQFLKQRETWRGYAISGLETAIAEHFDGPSRSPFMECDYVPRDRERFRHVLPSPNSSVRVQTVGAEAPGRFRSLLEAVGAVNGAPILVNTSFNGFREPMVCSPRDAIRVFFGTGVDLLILGEFVLTK
jgi:carbamoyltransferase